MRLASNEALSLLKLEAPGLYSQIFNKSVDDLLKEESLCTILDRLAVALHQAILGEIEVPLASIFAWAERMMQEGEEDVRTAIATCFLESFINRNTPSVAWAHLLGAESKIYCRAWDEFTGAFTEGLWDDVVIPDMFRDNVYIATKMVNEINATGRDDRARLNILLDTVKRLNAYANFMRGQRNFYAKRLVDKNESDNCR